MKEKEREIIRELASTIQFLAGRVNELEEELRKPDQAPREYVGTGKAIDRMVRLKDQLNDKWEEIEDKWDESERILGN